MSNTVLFFKIFAVWFSGFYLGIMLGIAYAKRKISVRPRNSAGETGTSNATKYNPIRRV